MHEVTHIHTHIKYLLLLVCGLIAYSVMGQNGGNPFEIVDRLERVDTMAVLQTENPFEIGLEKVHLPKRHELETVKPPPPKRADSSTFIFWLIMVMLVLLAIITSTSRETLTKVYRSFTNQNFMSLMHRNMQNVLHPPYLLLYLLFLLNISLFVLFLIDYYLDERIALHWKTYLSLTALITILFIARHLLLSFIGWIFPFGKEIRLYSYSIAIFNIIIGLFLMPVNILFAYSASGFQMALIYIALGVMALIYLVRTLRALLLANRYLLFHKFHFLLYLCGVEIAPVLILIKLIENQGGII